MIVCAITNSLKMACWQVNDKNLGLILEKEDIKSVSIQLFPLALSKTVI